MHPRQVGRLHGSILSTAACLLALAVASPAHAALSRVGPASADPQIGGYPLWYQDPSGLSLEFCDPLNERELSGGWCLILPGDTTVPESFPASFFDEHFYFAETAAADPVQGGKGPSLDRLEGERGG